MMYVSPATGREIKAILFDTFGTVVDWRSGVARDVTDFARRHRIDLDTAGFADAWRAKYEPSMERIRNENREFVPPDQLHLENLHATLAEFGLNAVDFPRTTELGPDQTKDLAAEGDWDLVCASILDLSNRFADA
jgi:2-haloacid dehalogenase